MKKIINYIKSLNWTLLFVCICMTTLGAASNENFHSISIVLLVGLVSGIIFGLPMAIIGRDDDNW